MRESTVRKRRAPTQDHFDPTISRGILAILLVITAILVLLSFAGKASTVGIIIDEWVLSFLFGHLRYVTPVFFLGAAYYIIREKPILQTTSHTVGAFLFFLSFSSLIHLHFEPSDMWRQAIEGHGGGIFGMPAWILKTYVGSLGSTVILVGLLLVSALLLCHNLFFILRDYYRASVAHMTLVTSSMKERVITEEDMHTDNTTFDEASDDQDDHAEKDTHTHRFKKMVIEDEDDVEDDMVEEEEEIEDDDEADDSIDTKKLVPVIPPSTYAPPQTAQDAVWARKPIIKPLPKLVLLSTKKGKPTSGDIEKNQKIIRDTFREFRIDVEMVDVRVGPTVTQYTLKPAKGIKVAKITTLQNDLALALAAHPLRIEAPIPGKSLVGIEVPNEKTALVSMREMLESKEFLGREHDMMIALGKDVAGKVWFVDLPRMPHLLIAGATGSGKTVCMHTIILSLLYQHTAETLRMIMVDPKRVELTLYNGIPHLLAPVITNTKKTVHALNWTIGEMDRRFELLASVGCRDIGSYNKAYPNNKLPFIIFFIDELADLMAQAANEVEGGIIRIAQLARAVGIHLIVATQRPSVDVITGLMKANIPGRIAFSVASLTDSRTILDSGGAEKLLGRGDMLHVSASLGKPVRIQGAFLSDEEVHGVVDYLKSGVTGAYDENLFSGETFHGAGDGNAQGTEGEDALLYEAKIAVVEAGKASASFLQRKLKVGYARAARMLDELEAAGVIGPGNGAKPREILITMDDVERTRSKGVHPAATPSVFRPQEPASLLQEDTDVSSEEDDYSLDEEHTSDDIEDSFEEDEEHDTMSTQDEDASSEDMEDEKDEPSNDVFEEEDDDEVDEDETNTEDSDSNDSSNKIFYYS